MIPTAIQEVLENALITGAFYAEFEERSRGRDTLVKGSGCSAFFFFFFLVRILIKGTNWPSLLGRSAQTGRSGGGWGWPGRSLLRGAEAARGFRSVPAPLHPSLSRGSWPPFSVAPPCFCWQRTKNLAGLQHPPSGYTGEAISVAFSQESWRIGLESAKGFEMTLRK